MSKPHLKLITNGMKIICEECGVRLNKVYVFRHGYYCEPCAEKVRRTFKNREFDKEFQDETVNHKNLTEH